MASAEDVVVKVKADVDELLTRKRLAIACAVMAAIGLVAIFVGVVLYVREAKDNAEAQGFSKAKQAEISAQQKIIDAAEDRLKKRDEDYQRDREAWQREREQMRTVPQAIAAMQHQAPQAAGQITQASPDQIAQAVISQLPNSPSYAVMTQQGAVALGQAALDAKQCRADLTKCTDDGKDIRAQLQAALTQKQDALADRDNWKQKAEGGTKTHRAVRGGILGTCAAGGAAVGANKGSKGAAIGALAGFTVCALATH